MAAAPFVHPRLNTSYVTGPQEGRRLTHEQRLKLLEEGPDFDAEVREADVEWLEPPDRVEDDG